MNGKIWIGGKEHDYEVLYNDIPTFLTRWNSIYWLATKEYKDKTGQEYVADDGAQSLIIPNQFYFWICWKCLIKKGWWRWKKPYRSMRSMVKHIRKDEFQAMVDLAGRDILELRMSEDREPGNEKQQSRDTLQQ